MMDIEHFWININDTPNVNNCSLRLSWLSRAVHLKFKNVDSIPLFLFSGPSLVYVVVYVVRNLIKNSQMVGWRRGTSPPRSHRSIRESLDSYGSSYPADR